MREATPGGGGAPLRILVTDRIISRFEPELTKNAKDNNWTFAASMPQDQILDAMATTDVLVCSAMSEAMAAAAKRLRLVHVTGAGYDKIPLAKLPAQAAVANTYHHGRPIAEHVMMVTLMLLRRVVPVDREMRNGTWHTIANTDEVPFHPTLEGRTMGLLGFGGIGQEVAHLATAIGMKVRAVRRDPDAALSAGLEVDWMGGMNDLETLMATSDVVVITVPLSAETRGLINDRTLKNMKSTALLVNVARGPVIEESALYSALLERTIAGAALDVWWANPNDVGNPPPSSLPFSKLENVILTPHYSGHARITFERRAADIAANIENLRAGRPLLNIVRPPS